MSQQIAPRRVYRSRTDRVVGGVAGGFGRYLGVDPAFVRIVLILLAFAGGVGLLVYLAAWLVLPEEPVGGGSDPSGGPPHADAHPRSGWIVVAAVALMLVLVGVSRVGFGLRPGLIWPLALIGFGVAILWLRSADGSVATGPAPAGGAPEPDAPPPGAPHWAAGPSARVATTPATTTPASDPGAPSAPWTVPPVTPSPLRRAAPVLGRIVVALAAAVVILVAAAASVLALEGPGSLSITPLEAVVAAVVTVLVAVALGLRFHRLPDLVAVAVPLVFVLAIAGWVSPPFRGGFGTRDVRPADVSSLERSYHLAGGDLRLDLGTRDLGGRSRTVTMSVAAGRLRIVVPAQATVTLDAHVDAGRIEAFGVRDNGVDVSRRTTAPGTGATLHVKARVGFGQIIVERPSSPGAGSGSTAAAHAEVAA